MYVLFSYVSQGLCTLTLGSTASSSWGWKGKGKKILNFFFFCVYFRNQLRLPKYFSFYFWIKAVPFSAVILWKIDIKKKQQQHNFKRWYLKDWGKLRAQANIFRKFPQNSVFFCALYSSGYTIDVSALCNPRLPAALGSWR